MMKGGLRSPPLLNSSFHAQTVIVNDSKYFSLKKKFRKKLLKPLASQHKVVLVRPGDVRMVSEYMKILMQTSTVVMICGS